MVINQRYLLNKSFEKTLSLLYIWINESTGRSIYEIQGFYIKTSNYEPLSSSSYIPLPKILNNSMKGLINLKNKDHKCFLWCHVRLFNPQNENAERISKEDKKIAAKLNYSIIDFPLDINDYELIEDRFEMNVCIFGYDNNVYPLYVSKKYYDQVITLLLITQDANSHYVFIKDFSKLMI